jgi:hypothetical protein
MLKNLSVPFNEDPSHDSRLDLARSCIAEAEERVANQQRLVQCLKLHGRIAQEAEAELARLNILLLQAHNHHDILSVLLSPPQTRKAQHP